MKKVYITLFTLFTLSLFVCMGAYSLLYNEYDNQRAVEYLESHAESHSTNSCAKYVRLAIEAGGCPTFGQPPAACDYEYFLPDLGFSRVSADDYTPQMGDVVVFSAIKGHKSGHIAMYDGRQWISDFKQRSMYSATAYRSHGTRSYWRRADGRKWRKLSLRPWMRYLGIKL